MARKILSGHKVCFRLIEKKDLAKRVEWINDTAVQETLNFDYPTSLGRTNKWFETIIHDRTRVDFSIFLIESEQYIGFCGLLNINHYSKKAELYYTIGDRNYWGQGFGTESLILLTNYGFIELGLNRLYGYYNAENTKSAHIIHKLGWKHEGTLRQDLFSHGKIHDRNIVAILRGEWELNKIYDL